MLQDLAATEDADLLTSQPDPEPLVDVEQFENGKVTKLWDEMHRLMVQPGISGLQRCAFQQLEAIHERLRGPKWPYRTLYQYQKLLDDFVAVMQPESYHNRVLRLSSTRATGSSMHLIQRRVEAMRVLLDGAPKSLHERKWLWEDQRSKQLELFVSEVSQSLLVMHELDGEEDRSAFLALLKSEISASGSAYTKAQLAVLEKAYNEVAKDASPSVVTTVQPWFLPWYELVVDTSTYLGVGGFGSVYRAKWLDSDVVVKQVRRLGAQNEPEWSAVTTNSQQSTIRTATRDRPEDTEERLKMRRMFEREVSVWFGLSHPHVVRLFGACHVGIPFFAREYASNGSLDKYLRKHPKELWSKLYEAALGVQYLQARGIIHGDLKCNNIVVGSDGKAKVTEFGLSSEIEQTGAELTGALQWVAPECLKNGASNRSFASDVYALGMCVVEALRVVLATTLKKDERGYVPLPWGNLDNSVVKYHVIRKELPQRPEQCTDGAWRLVERMCAPDPADRIKISTVVDELAKLAGANAPDKIEEKPSTAAEAIPAIIAEMKSENSTTRGALQRIYSLLRDRLEHVSSVIEESRGDLDLLRPIVDRAHDSTTRLEYGSLLETQLIEAAFRGYDLHRRLDKLIDANFWSVNGEGGEVHRWESACKSFLHATEKSEEPVDNQEATCGTAVTAAPIPVVVAPGRDSA